MDRNKVKRFLGTEDLGTIENTIRQTPTLSTVSGNNFFYFAFQPIAGNFEISFLKSTSRVSLFEVKNLKGVTSGYLFLYKDKPKINADSLGVSLFYSKLSNKDEYENPPKNLYSDRRIRLFCFKQKDYFVSVRWKSVNVEE